MKQSIYILTLALLFSCSESDKFEVVETWPDGSHKSTKVYLDNKDKSDYLIKDYHENGRLSFEGKVKNNQFVEYKKSYFPNGNKEEFVELAAPADLTYCCPNGFYKVYYENGQLEETHYKRNGLFNGLVTKYDSSGNKTAEYQMSDDLKNGGTKSFYANGKTKSIKEFRNDTLVGTVYYFTESGDSLKKNGTHKGKLDFPIKYWKENGNSLYGEYNNNYYQVRWTWFDSLGNKIKTEVVDTVNGQFVTPDY